MKPHFTLLLLTGSLLTGFASTSAALDLSPWSDAPKSDRDGLSNGRLRLAENPAKIILTLSADYGLDHQGQATLFNQVDFRVSWKAGDGSDYSIDPHRLNQIHREVRDGVYRGNEGGDQGDQGDGHGSGDSGDGDAHRHHKPKKPSE